MRLKRARILLFDIETSPNLGYTWQKWEQNVIAFKKEWELLSVAWKFVGEKTKVVCRKDFKDKTDKSIAQHIWNLFQEADILVAHNGNSFDIKKCKARFLFHKLKPTKRLVSIDTKVIAKTHFSFNSNSLNDLGEHLGVGSKIKHEGFDLWLKCMSGNAAAWEKMKAYNAQDVELLYRVYKRMKPWITNHPSLAVLQERIGCPNCGSDRVRKGGVRASHTNLRQQMFCKDCHGWYLTRYKKQC